MDKMKIALREITWLPLNYSGWGNGYVVIPKGHFLHGKHYDDINVTVHGGLTFSELVIEEMLKVETEGLTEDDIGSWMVGFDTAHLGDSRRNWTKSKVKKEAERLKKNLMQLKEDEVDASK